MARNAEVNKLTAEGKSYINRALELLSKATFEDEIDDQENYVVKEYLFGLTENNQ